MPADDYTPPIRGALKLKGVKDSKIDKKKKKKRKAAEDSDVPSKSKEPATTDQDGDEKTGESEELEELGAVVMGSGKTGAEMRHEEMKRKRVRDSPHIVTLYTSC